MRKHLAIAGGVKKCACERLARQNCESPPREAQPTTRLALQLSALLFARPGELRLARWKEIDFEEAVWTAPAATMKMKRPHRVPLSRQAIISADHSKDLDFRGP